MDTTPVHQLLSASGYPDPATPPVSALEADVSLHPSLRSPDYAPTANMMPSGVPPSDHPGGPPDNGLSPPGMEGEGRKAKRELSNSKRAAQNRAAQVSTLVPRWSCVSNLMQRAFRQRKEGYIKKLEQQVRDLDEMEKAYENIQAENHALKEYVAHLQSRLSDAGIEIPQAPPHINLTAAPGPVRAVDPTAHGLPQPGYGQEDGPPAEPTPNTGSAGGASSLDAVAQAVQSLSRSEASYKAEAADTQAAEDARTAEEIARQLQASEPAPAADM